jgi:hypothetical protein
MNWYGGGNVRGVRPEDIEHYMKVGAEIERQLKATRDAQSPYPVPPPRPTYRDFEGDLLRFTREVVRAAEPKKKEAKTLPRHLAIRLFETLEDRDCKVCLKEVGADTVAFTMCGHHFCEGCLDDLFARGMKCPSCRGEL